MNTTGSVANKADTSHTWTHQAGQNLMTVITAVAAKLTGPNIDVGIPIAAGQGLEIEVSNIPSGTWTLTADTGNLSRVNVIFEERNWSN